MPILRIKDIDLHYEITDFTDPWKQAETVLLHHGFARNLKLWYPWVPLLCRHFRVITLDSRGCGDSTIPPEDHHWRLEELGDDAVGLLDALGVERVHWGAEASGGIVGLDVAKRHPSRIASLTLCNTPIKLPQSTNDAFNADEVMKLGVGHWARATAPRRFDLDKLAPGFLDWSCAQHDRTLPRVAVAVHHMLEGADSWAMLPDIVQPVLILAGEGSKIATLDQVKQMAERLPKSKLVVFKGYGQGIAFSNADACATEMRKFILDGCATG